MIIRLFICIFALVFPLVSFAFIDELGTHTAGNSVQDLMKVSGGVNSANEDTNISITAHFLTTIQSYIIGLMGVVSVGVLIWVGFKLISAQGNPEEFKKAWMTLLYVAIGLTLVQGAYAIVRIVINYNL